MVILGRQGTTSSAQALLQGDKTSLPTQHLLPETMRILDTLTRPYPTISTPTPTAITEEEFIRAYNHVKEQASSSPSGRHVGQYKAFLDEPTIVSLHSAMMSLPFQHGFVPEQWTKVTDIMLRKDADTACCH